MDIAVCKMAFEWEIKFEVKEMLETIQRKREKYSAQTKNHKSTLSAD